MNPLDIPNPARTAHLSRAALLSLTRPNRTFFERQRALLRKAVPAGLAAPAVDHDACHVATDEPPIQYKESTFFMRAIGHSMRHLGIHDGDLLIIDRALPATDGCVVVAAIDGEFTVKRLHYTSQGKVLRTAHPDLPDIVIGDEQGFYIWGVVQWNLHKV